MGHPVVLSEYVIKIRDQVFQNNVISVAQKVSRHIDRKSQNNI
jgi:hypothetical protein